MEPVEVDQLINGSTSVLVATICVAALLWLYLDFKQYAAYWKRRGIRGPAPWPLLGNMHIMFLSRRQAIEQKWTQQYGRIHGIFRARKPHLVIADAEVMRQICIKDFDAFPNHEPLPMANKYQSSFLFFLQDDQWRRTRAIMSPTFTSGKLRRMYKLVDLCADDLIQCFSEQFQGGAQSACSEATCDLKQLFSLYTLDAIASCGYGLKLERAGTITSTRAAALRNELVRITNKLFQNRPLRLMLLLAAPKRLLDLLGYQNPVGEGMVALKQLVGRVIEARRQNADPKKKYDDYLQLLLDAKLDDTIELDEQDAKEDHHAQLEKDSLLSYQRQIIDAIDQRELPPAEEQRASGANLEPASKLLGSRIKLSELEVITNGAFLLIVGLETTATLLTGCVYALAFHPEVQEQLYREAKSIAEFDADKKKFVFPYDKLTASAYVDSVICETLRRHSPVTQVDRQASRDFYLEKCSLKIPKGGKLLLAYHNIMRDPEYWPEPEKFDPTRFMPENRHKIVPGSYCPFGLGPRHCIGMRFSLTEAKLGLVKLIMNFKFEPAPGTKYPPDIKWTINGLNNIKNPTVKFSHRVEVLK